MMIYMALVHSFTLMYSVSFFNILYFGRNLVFVFVLCCVLITLIALTSLNLSSYIIVLLSMHLRFLILI